MAVLDPSSTKIRLYIQFVPSTTEDTAQTPLNIQGGQVSEQYTSE